MDFAEIIHAHQNRASARNLSVENLVWISGRQLIFPCPDCSHFLAPAFFSRPSVGQVNDVPQAGNAFGGIRKNAADLHAPDECASLFQGTDRHSSAEIFCFDLTPSLYPS